jgi:hypothetical protein
MLKIKKILLLLPTALLCACGKNNDSLIDFSDESSFSNSAEVLYSTDDSSVPSGDSEVNSDSLLQERINEIKSIFYSDEADTRMVPWIFPCLFTNGHDSRGNQLEVTSDSVPSENGRIKMTLNMCAYHDVYGKDHIPVTITMLMIVNGEIYDFSVGEYTSSSGLMMLELPSNTEYIAQFESNEVNLKKGENEFEVITLGYCSETDSYLQPQQFTGYLYSEKEYTGNSTVTVSADPDIPNIIAETTEGKTEAEIQSYLPELSMFDYSSLIKPVNAEGYVTIKQSALLSFPLQNSRVSNKLCSGTQLCFVMCNGEPYAAWNQEPYILISMSETELMKSIPMETDFHAGDRANFQLVSINISEGAMVASYSESNIYPLLFSE